MSRKTTRKQLRKLYTEELDSVMNRLYELSVKTRLTKTEKSELKVYGSYAPIIWDALRGDFSRWGG